MNDPSHILACSSSGKPFRLTRSVGEGCVPEGV